MKILTMLLAACLTLPQLASAEEPSFTSKDLYEHLGIRGYKWNHEVEEAFTKVTVSLVQYSRDEFGKLRKTIISRQTTNSPKPWKAGSHPVTAMFDKEKCSLSFLDINLSCSESENMMWADRDASYCEGYPMYLGGEYIFMVKWRDGNVSTNKGDMESYLCMTIETSQGKTLSSSQPTRLH